MVQDQTSEAVISRSIKMVLRHYSEALLLAILLAVVLRVYVLSAYRVSSDHMRPSLLSGDFVLAFKYPLALPLSEEQQKKWFGQSIARGHVVAFHCWPNQSKTCVKRLVGLPGDRIELKKGELFINGEFSRKYSSTLSFGPQVVPPDQFFVLSEDLQFGQDSRQWGSLSMGLLVGEIRYIALSFDWAKPWAGGLLPSMRWVRILRPVD